MTKHLKNLPCTGVDTLNLVNGGFTGSVETRVRGNAFCMPQANNIHPKNSLSVSTEVGDIESLLNEAMLFKDSEFFEPFCERLKFLIDTQSALVPGVAFYRDGSTATACELVIPLKPSDSLICLFSALRAEDGDFSAFDHEYSFSQSIETQQ